MFSAQARWLLLAGLSSGAFIACGGEEPDPMGGAGTGGSSAGSQVGGSAGKTGGSGGSVSGGSAGSNGTAGSAGSGGGAGGAGGGAGGAGGGGAGGASGGGAGGGGAGGGGSEPTAVANIMGVNGMTVTGTATFTQGATMTKLVMNLTACPDGPHSSHLHVMNDCGMNGDAAGNHWPNGEMLGDYTCANGTGTLTKEKPIQMWTVGGDAATDVTKHAYMVHLLPDTAASGQRIGCGVFPAQ